MSRPARPASSAFSSSSAAAASAEDATATASARAPRAAASAASWPASTVSSAATDPSRPGSRRTGGEQRARAVLAGQAERQRLAAGLPGRALPLGLPLGLGQLAHPRLGLLVRGDGGLVPLVEAELALVERADLGLHPIELGLGVCGSLAGLGGRRGQPGDLLAAGGGRVRSALTCPVSLARPSRRSATARAAATSARSASASRFSSPGGPDCVGQRHVRAVQGRLQLAFLGTHLAGLGLDRLGVAPGADLVRSADRWRARSAASGAVPRKRSSRADRRYQVSWAVASCGASAAIARSSSASARALGEGRLDLGAALADGLLVGDLAVELGAQADEVVGEQPQPRVAQLGLDPGGAAGDLGLPAEGLELAAKLAGEVGDPGQVGLHRVELAQRLFLALAVFEDAGGLFDEAAAILRTGLQHRVELALPDDDVHLAADAGVGEQLLDVEQPGRVAVDLVLAGAVAEHPAGDRDLGVVDRQRVVGVVDGERDLGPAERRARGRAGEDDVFHLAAAQRLGALLAEHPGDGVDDVGLARPVGPDDGGDAGLEAKRRGRGEGLEALERQRLEVHESPRSACGDILEESSAPRSGPAAGRPDLPVPIAQMALCQSRLRAFGQAVQLKIERRIKFLLTG